MRECLYSTKTREALTNPPPPPFALRKFLGSQEISWASGMDFPIPPSFWWSTDTMLNRSQLRSELSNKLNKLEKSKVAFCLAILFFWPSPRKYYLCWILNFNRFQGTIPVFSFPLTAHKFEVAFLKWSQFLPGLSLACIRIEEALILT